MTTLSQDEIDRLLTAISTGDIGPTKDDESIAQSRLVRVILDLTQLSISSRVDKDVAYELMTMARTLSQAHHEMEKKE